MSIACTRLTFKERFIRALKKEEEEVNLMTNSKVKDSKENWEKAIATKEYADRKIEKIERILFSKFNLNMANTKQMKALTEAAKDIFDEVDLLSKIPLK